MTGLLLTGSLILLAYAVWVAIELATDCNRLTDENAKLRSMLRMHDDDRIAVAASLERSRRNLPL